MNRRFILVTGASSGIGREIAIKLSLHYNIIANGRNEARLKETISLCSSSGNHLMWQYDLA